MDNLPLPQLIDFLQQAISCCRTNAAIMQVPAYARARLTDAANNVEFFLGHCEYQRAFQEARLATGVNKAVVRYIQASAAASTALREELDEE